MNDARQTILVVDDEKTNRILLSHVLEERCRIILAKNGVEALERAREHQPDLILLDVLMPEMDGYEVIRMLKQDDRTRGIPVIFVTALDSVVDEEMGLGMGAVDYISKPFHPPVVQARVHNLLEAIHHRRLLEKTTKELSRALDHLRETQQQLVVREKLAALGMLTSGIAHELKNPLHLINNFATLCVELSAEAMQELSRASALPSAEGRLQALLHDVQQSAGSIRTHGQRADRIIRAMLDHARSSAREPAEVDWNELVRSHVHAAWAGQNQQSERPRAALTFHLDPAAGLALVVPEEIGRVMTNLVSNAMYAAGAKHAVSGPSFTPEILVTTVACGDAVEARVRDNGDGIPAWVRDKVFMPFFTTKPPGDGTGLGLSISHDIIVRGHGGKIGFETEENQFTEFYVTVPRRRR